MTTFTHCTGGRPGHPTTRHAGRREVGARIVAALLAGPRTAAQIVDATGYDRETVRCWLRDLRNAGAAVERGRMYVPAGTGQVLAPVWAIRGQG